MTERRNKYHAKSDYIEELFVTGDCPIVPYVRMTRRGKFTSAAAQRYMANQDELRLVMHTSWMLPPQMPLTVDIAITVPREVGHRCDLDNLLKALLDAGNGILYADDRWIDTIRVRREIGEDWHFEMEAMVK